MTLDELLNLNPVRARRPPWYDDHRVVIAPNHRDAELLIREMRREWNPGRVKIITRVEQLRGRNLAEVEVWWTGTWGMEGVYGFRTKNEMRQAALARGAKGFWTVRV